jgi:hypothetical protein
MKFRKICTLFLVVFACFMFSLASGLSAESAQEEPVDQTFDLGGTVSETENDEKSAAPETDKIADGINGQEFEIQQDQQVICLCEEYKISFIYKKISWL